MNAKTLSAAAMRNCFEFAYICDIGKSVPLMFQDHPRLRYLADLAADCLIYCNGSNADAWLLFFRRIGADDMETVAEYINRYDWKEEIWRGSVEIAENAG